jgi:hypothetical protein
MGWADWESDGLAGVLLSVDFDDFLFISVLLCAYFLYPLYHKSKTQIVYKLMLVRRVT